MLVNYCYFISVPSLVLADLCSVCGNELFGELVKLGVSHTMDQFGGKALSAIAQQLFFEIGFS